MTYNDYEMIRDIINGMPEGKKEQLRSTLERNYLLTTCYDLPMVEIRTYIEGWQVILSGTKCRFSIWAFDRDGEFEYGRKPVEKKLHLLHGEYGATWPVGIDFNNI